MSQTKTTRLNALYERLKSANGVSIGELAKEFEVSAKTIQRILRLCKGLGRIKVGGCFIWTKALPKMS